jgi:ring-1,2-phenylacetyl-CoA epoxidase subunit PaaC
MASPTSEAPLPEVPTVADACLIASHRLTEWVSNAPTMEEDVALGNIALDLLGQARGLYGVLGNEDRLAYFRDAGQWHNPVICELPNGDFGHTMLRQLFLDYWFEHVWTAWLGHDDEVVRGVAEKAVKENAYHRRHSHSWVVRLGDGTDESHRRMTVALDALWPYVGPLAVVGWLDSVRGTLDLAELGSLRSPLPRVDGHPHLPELLADMQSLARAHPGAAW